MKWLLRFLYFNIIFGLIVFVMSCGSTRRAFERAEPKMPFDVIIVPGVPYDTAWSDIMKLRVLWSYHLYNRGLTKNIIFTGSAVYSPYIESRIMASYAKELGVLEAHIFTEELAEHSTENVFYSYYMAKDLGFENIALASDPFQTAMLKSFIKTKKLDMSFAPTIFDTIGAYYSDVNIKIDANWAKVDSFVSITEREGFWKRLDGTMGKNIKFKPEEITNATMKYPRTE